MFLFFLAGLEIAFDARDDRHLGLVGAAFVISLVLALVVALIFDAIELVDAPLFVAIILAATSFGIVVAVLKDADQTGTPFGQLVIAGASLADFATVILLSLFFSSSGASFETTLVLLLLFLGVVGALGRPWPARAARARCAPPWPPARARAPRSASGSLSCCWRARLHV